jgi:hypothetical protein
MNTCSTCRFWGWPGEVEYDGSKQCARIGAYPSDTIPPDAAALVAELPPSRASAASFTGAVADGAMVFTDSTFGCVEWMRRLDLNEVFPRRRVSGLDGSGLRLSDYLTEEQP